MTDIASLRISFVETANAFVHLLEGVDDINFNRRPSSNSWTPGQLAIHVLKSLSGVAIAMKASGVITNRPADEYVSFFKNMLEDVATKRKAPASVMPDEGPFEKERLLLKLKEKNMLIANAIEGQDLDLLIPDMPFPHTGDLTRLEWIWFGIYHTRRHMTQLREILLKLEEQPTKATD